MLLWRVWGGSDSRHGQIGPPVGETVSKRLCPTLPSQTFSRHFHRAHLSHRGAGPIFPLVLISAAARCTVASLAGDINFPS